LTSGNEFMEQIGFAFWTKGATVAEGWSYIAVDDDRPDGRRIDLT
jgi:hypothetical protein